MIQFATNGVHFLFLKKIGDIQSLNLQKVDHINHQMWPKKVLCDAESAFGGENFNVDEIE